MEFLYSISGIFLRIPFTLQHSISPTTLTDRYYYFNFIDEKAKAWRFTNLFKASGVARTYWLNIGDLDRNDLSGTGGMGTRLQWVKE